MKTKKYNQKFACLLTALTLAAAPVSALDCTNNLSYESIRAELCSRWGICLDLPQKPDFIPPEIEVPDFELPENGTPDTEAPDVELPEADRPTHTPEVETPENDTPSIESGAVDAYAQEVVRLVNAERANYGLSALTLDRTVSAAAQVRAQEIISTFSHTRPNGTSCFTALQQAGVNYRGAGENIAYGQSSAQAVVNAWMNSEGHRANILNEKYTTIGVGHLVSGGTHYWTQFFTY